jgi:hypothetical protein
MVQSAVSSEKQKATIMSLPLELYFMIIERLGLKNALNMAKALRIPEQVAVQYFAFDRSDIGDIIYKDFYDLKPSSFKFLLKNKRFQIKADSYEKTNTAIRTLDLDFLKKYLEQVEPNLDGALITAALIGFTDAVKLLLSDYGVDPSADDNWALRCASENGHLETVKLLESHPRFKDGPLEDSDFDSSLSENESSLAESDY